MNDQSAQHAHAFHGGRFFEAIGTDFNSLEHASQVISADVLDAWFDPSPRVIARLQEYLPFLLRTSPPAYADGLIRAISEAREIPEQNLCAGGGSSQLIFTALPELTTAARRVLILDPMYGEYAHVLETVLQREVHRHFLREQNGFRINTASLLCHVQQLRPELVVIVNPNSPTGAHWPRTEMIQFLDRLTDALCVVDETYIDYVSAAESLEPLVSRYPNLIIIKSMSKVYALSGARAAYMVGSSEIITRVARKLPPWSVSLPAQVAAAEALNDTEYYRKRYEETHALRTECLEMMHDVPGIDFFDSCANFYLLKLATGPASAIQQQLERGNIFVRHCGSMSRQFRDDYLRIAVKSREQNRRIAEALRHALGCESDQRAYKGNVQETLTSSL